MPEKPSSPTLTRAEQVEDLDHLLATIESHHADPYIGYDSRVELYARTEEIAESVSEEASVETVYRTLSPLLAGLDDVHSIIHPPTLDGGCDGDNPPNSSVRSDSDTPAYRLPFSFRVVGDSLYVEAVANESHEDLLGRRLHSVEGVELADLAEQAKRLRGAENAVYARRQAGSMIESYDPLARLLDRTAPPTDPTLRFGADDDPIVRSISPVSEDCDTVASLDTSVPRPDGPGPRSRFFAEGSVALFVPGDLSGYRESFEVALATDAGRAAEIAPAAYERHVGGDLPEDTDDLVAELPSMVETLDELTATMKAEETETLVVDLRDNPGGDSQFLFHLAYALGGWDRVREAVESISAVKRRSGPHRERYGQFASDATPTLDHQYDLSDYHGTDRDDTPGDGDQSSDGDASDDGSAIGVSEDVRERLHRSETFAEFTERTDEDGVYDPGEVIVVTSAGTMSSAFAAAAQLRSLGATHVGVPAGQAPRSFGEAIEITLPNSELTVSVACSMYDWVRDPDGDTLEPDRELDEETFERFDRAGDTGLRLAFEVAGIGDDRLTTRGDQSQ
jgi:hypothetical protein